MDKMIFLPEYSGLVYPATPTEVLAVQLLEAGAKMRRAQNRFFDLRSRQRKTFTDPIVKDALQDSIKAENHFDELLESVKQKAVSQQYMIFQED